jgi:hypothetical protein
MFMVTSVTVATLVTKIITVSVAVAMVKANSSEVFRCAGILYFVMLSFADPVGHMV